MKAFLVSFIKKTTYFFAACLVIVALAVSVSHYLSPVVAKHRPDIEKWASALLNTPVTINQVELSWYQYQPVINLNAVTVLNKTSKEPELQIKKVRLFFSLPKSLWYFKPILSGILISGSEVIAHSEKGNDITIQGFPAFDGKEPYKSETRINDILGWLSQQPRLILQDIDIHYTPASGKSRYVTLQKLSILNSANKHIILGNGILHQDLPTSLNLAIDWSGNPTDLTSIKANIYAYVSGISLSQWLKGSELYGWQIKKGIGSAKIWVAWQKSAIQQIQTTFQVYDVALYSANDQTTHTINRLSGNVGWRLQDDQQIIAGDEILIDLPKHLWPMTSFHVDLAQGAQGQWQPRDIRTGYIDLDDLQSFLFSSAHFLPEEVYDYLSHIKPTGRIQDVAINFAKPNWRDWQQLSFKGNAVQISTTSWKQWPGIKNLSASVLWDQNHGELELKNTTPVTLHYDAIFAKPIVLNQFTGKITSQVDDHHVWKFTTTGLQILNNDLAANVKGQLTWALNSTSSSPASPQVDLNSHFTLQRADRITNYLPLKIFDKSLVTWLQQAFKGGEIKAGEAILKGSLNDFPFDQGNGTFMASGILANMDLRYAPDWPPIKKLGGKIVFSGRKMIIDMDEGQMLDIPLSKVHGVIPSIGGDQPATLEVSDHSIQTDFKEGIRFVRASPLNESIGKMFTGIDMNGPITLKLGLSVPLQDPDNTKVKGDIQFENANMNMPQYELQINRLAGLLHFTENNTDAKNIQGFIFNKPLNFDLATHNKIVTANFKTHVAIDDLQQWLKIPFSNMIKGESDVNGSIDLALNAPIQIHLQSDLVGMALKLPYQYGKEKAEAKPLNADISLQEKRPIRIMLNYGKTLGGTFILNKVNQEYSLQGANLHLGNGEIPWPKGAGLYISGNFDTLDLDTIKQYTQKYNQKSGEQSAFVSELPLRAINLQINQLSLGSQDFKQVNLQMAKNEDGWNIHVDSPDISGEIEAPLQFNNKGAIKAKFHNIILNSSSSSTSDSIKIDVKSLPALNIDAENVSYDHINLGTVNFDATPASDGLSINSFRVSSPRMNLRAKGEWLATNETHLRGAVTTSNVSGLLNSLGVGSSNYIVSTGHLNFDLAWNNAPFAPSIKEFTGNARLDVGHGRIVDIGESNNAKMDIARMLNIFSLQNLPRRLTLDFSDLFQKGYSFDYIRGDFAFRNGDAFTQNLEINGPVIRVNIDGRISLRSKIYDLTLSIMPHDVTSGLPLAATFLIPNPIAPIIGLAALGVNTVLSPSLSQAVAYSYNVSGPWSNPKWRTVSR